MAILEKVVVRFGKTNSDFRDRFAALVGAFGQGGDNLIEIRSSDRNFYPKISLDIQSRHPGILTDFILSDKENISVTVENSTGLSKQSPYSYKPLSVGIVKQRLANSDIRLIGIDHVGCNLPWFSSNLHPRILELREKLSPRCLYHRFPTGEPWDFILPGDNDEIANRKAIDYTKVRRPKFELVSFDNASTPLIQFDVGVNASYERFSRLFPEALNDLEFRNIWVYLESPYAVDVCLVINEFTEGDWSDFFDGSRIEW